MGRGELSTSFINGERLLLTIAAVAECLAGISLIFLPGFVIALLGTEPHRDGLIIGRLAGVALLCLGIACWGARADGGGAARTGTRNAITLYNVAAGLLLVVFAATSETAGLPVWITGILHLGLAAALLTCLWRSHHFTE